MPEAGSARLGRALAQPHVRPAQEITRRPAGACRGRTGRRNDATPALIRRSCPWLPGRRMMRQRGCHRCQCSIPWGLGAATLVIHAGAATVFPANGKLQIGSCRQQRHAHAEDGRHGKSADGPDRSDPFASSDKNVSKFQAASQKK